MRDIKGTLIEDTATRFVYAYEHIKDALMFCHDALYYANIYCVLTGRDEDITLTDLYNILK